MKSLFNLSGKVIVITGGGGLLGVQHALAVHSCGGIPILADLDEKAANRAAQQVGGRALPIRLNVTDEESIRGLRSELLKQFGHIDVLINNAARNPKVEGPESERQLGRFEEQDLEAWNEDLRVGLTGAMLCSRFLGEQMAAQRKGVIVNIASDLALIGPDQRLYEREGRAPDRQPKKPASYSVVKSGLLGLTRYLATYWAEQGVRVNALCPGGVENGQDPVFLARISRLIPMGRMARQDEYHGALVFLCSDASEYMTGQALVVDGGRTVW